MWSPYRPTANLLTIEHGFVLFWRLCDTGTVTKRVHLGRSVGALHRSLVFRLVSSVSCQEFGQKERSEIGYLYRVLGKNVTCNIN